MPSYRWLLLFLTCYRRRRVVAVVIICHIDAYACVMSGDAAAGGLGLNILEIHSRKSQSARNKAAEAFRTGSGLFLFSSDVSARGMDFPDVTGVVQVPQQHPCTTLLTG
jgi:hypothetical protein